MFTDNHYNLLQLLFYFGISFLITFLTLPRVRNLALKFEFFDKPDARSSHENIVPTFGGVSFYIALLVAIFIANGLDKSNLGLTVITSLTIMFFTGLKDDLKNLRPRMKLLGQFIAVMVLVWQPDFRLDTLYGLFGIYQLSEFISMIISTFLFLGIINAYNLIDGIDGMASIIGIIIFSCFGLLFYYLGLLYFVALCVSAIGILVAFLRFNLSSRKKIFMGDTGSLFLGLLIGLMTMKLLTQDVNAFEPLGIRGVEIPLLLLGILFVPSFDLVRVIIIRLLKKNSITAADRNHIHHVFLDYGLSHKRSSLLIGVMNIFIIISVFCFIKYFGNLLSFIAFGLLILLVVLFFFYIKKVGNRNM